MYSSTLSLTSAAEWVGGQHYDPAAFLPGKRPGTHCIGGRVGLGAGLQGCGKSGLPPGFDLWTIQPVVGRYTEYDRGRYCLKFYTRSQPRGVPI
jgi:hypothetical protein